MTNLQNIRAALREAIVFADMSTTEDLPQHAAQLLATATSSLSYALATMSRVDVGDAVDGDFATATARVAEAAAQLARACSVE